MTGTLPSALEPELRRIIDTAVARVAAIELEAIREARELTQRSEQEARDALRFALDRAFNLINTLELLAATVGGMAEALKIELDDAIDALRNVPEPESALAREMAQPPAQQELPVTPPEPASAPEPAPPPKPAPIAAQPAPVPAPAAAQPAPVPAPAPAPAPEARKPEPQEPKPEARKPEPQKPEPEPQKPEPEQPEARGNGYPPAERQAESLAHVAARAPESQPEPQPEPRGTAVGATASGDDGRPAVPNRRRGLVRRLFTK